MTGALDLLKSPLDTDEPRVVIQQDAGAEGAYLTVFLGKLAQGVALPGFSHDHKKLIIPNEQSDNVAVFSLEELRVLGWIQLKPGSGPWQAKCLPTSERLAYVSNSRFQGSVEASDLSPSTVSVLDFKEMKVLTEIPVGAGPNGVTVDVHGKFGYIANMRSNTVTVIDVREHLPIDTIRVGAAPAFAKLTRDGKVLVVTNLASSSVTIISTETRRVVAELEVGVPYIREPFPEWGPGDTTGVAISDDHIAYLTNYRSHRIAFLNLSMLTSGQPTEGALEVLESPIQFPFFVEVDRVEQTILFSSGNERKFALLDHKTRKWLGVGAMDSLLSFPSRMKNLNLWMTVPEGDRITALLPGGLSGISRNWDRNMVAKFL